MYAIRRNSIDNLYGEENSTESYLLTDDASLIVNVDVDNLIFNIDDEEHLKQELLLKYPAPEGFTFLLEDDTICLSREVPKYLHGFRVLGTLQTAREVSKQQLLDACRKHGKVDIRNYLTDGRHSTTGKVDWEGKGDWDRGRSTVVDGEFVVDHDCQISYDPKKAKRLMAEQKRKPLNAIKNGNVPVYLLENLANMMEEVIRMHPVMYSFNSYKMMKGIFANSKPGYMARIFQYVRMIHMLYRGRDAWRVTLKRAPLSYEERSNLSYNVRMDGDVIKTILELFPYLKGLKKRIKGTLTKTDRKYWSKHKGGCISNTITESKAIKKMTDYVAIRNFIIFLEHEQRELK